MATAGGAAVQISPFLAGGHKKLHQKRSLQVGNGRKPVATTTKAMAWGSYGLDDLFLGVGVGLPCTVMECGDIIYRSTLPRSNGLTVTAPGVALALAAVSYLWATPGVAPGFWDMFVLAFLERLFRPTFRKDDFVLGKKLGEGAFGVVYKVSLAKNKPSPKV